MNNRKISSFKIDDTLQFFAHTHVWGSWQDNPYTEVACKEIRYCNSYSTCKGVDYRSNHSYGGSWQMYDSSVHWQRHKCIHCGETEDYGHTSHNMGSWYATSSTQERRDCGGCGWYETRTIEAPHEHNWSAWSSWSSVNNDSHGRYRTCLGGCGSEQTQREAHTYPSYGGYCTVCNHHHDHTGRWSNWSSWSYLNASQCIRSRTCMGCGAVENETPSHDFVGEVCQRCGYTSHVHDWGAWSEWENATSVNKCHRSRMCKKCYEFQHEFLDHTFDLTTFLCVRCSATEPVLPQFKLLKSGDLTMTLLASDWNWFTSAIGGKFSPPRYYGQVKSGGIILASKFNEAKNALSELGCVNLPPTKNKGDIIYANDINKLYRAFSRKFPN